MTARDLHDERLRFRAELDQNGSVVCPCCDRKAYLYKRRINRGMCEALLRLYRLPGEWHHISTFDPKRSDFPVLQHWDLIESRGDAPDDDHAKSSGYWRLTARGCAFAQDALEVRTYVILYDGIPQGFELPLTTISKVVGEFHYRELMEMRATHQRQHVCRHCGRGPEALIHEPATGGGFRDDFLPNHEFEAVT